ncbi:hypothetical protein [Methylomonas koyamae]|uniref:hypothetical protein n=1 Tax=Methylomonas koyamae TaxID=702114 RepID=UPI0006D23421|nr:hypothetical protein [Methylomonas koyamae]BBL57380.1 hypothetical protein MKFW12EY_09930 [Methylomonas koyamae]
MIIKILLLLFFTGCSNIGGDRLPPAKQFDTKAIEQELVLRKKDLDKARSTEVFDPNAVKPSGINTVFGLALGKVFNLPECYKSRYKPGYYEDFSKFVCFEKTLANRDASKMVLIQLPYEDFPLIVYWGSKLYATIIDDNLELIRLKTTSGKDIVLTKLKEKYGDPLKLESFDVKTKIGASFDAIRAEWRVFNIKVVYNSIDQNLDFGSLTIGTEKGFEDLDKSIQFDMQKGRQL